MITSITQDGVNTVSHLIQLSVAPVFLLAGVAGLLNVFTGRLSLNLRMQNINYAISLCTMTGLLIALVIVTMFLSSMFEFNGSIFIATLFIFAMVSLISSLVLF